MPLFKKASFKAARKIPRRRPDAGSVTNNQLTDKESLDPNVEFSQAPINISLGGRRMVFQDGSWLVQDEGGSGDSVQSNAEVQKLRKELQSIEEENNMLKYKVELLLDMLAVSNADLNVMEKELESLRKQVSERTAKK